MKDNISIRVTYSTKRMAMSCSNKDKTSDDFKSHCVYEFKCPGCSQSYIGKTDRNFLTRVEEHGTHSKDQDTVVYKHLESCTSYHDTVALYNTLRSQSIINVNQHIYHSVRNNTKLIALNDHWGQLCFLESLHREVNLR